MVAESTQLTLDFTPGLTIRFRSLRECVSASVYACPRGLSAVAADLDMSPSELTKRLNPEGSEPRPLRVDDLETILKSTGDFTPIYWLIEKHLRSDEARRSAAISQLSQMLPQLNRLMSELKQ
ncbi:MAG: hypothetical protein LBI35_07390 [Burkholderiales bacterium]|jgi:hypothetical protein|nr:hypothetical protein [Burkholderiales bacterium]